MTEEVVWLSGICERGSPGGSDGQESACNAGAPGLIPGSGRSPGEGNGNPLQYSRQKSLASPSPWGHKESDMTERLTFHIWVASEQFYRIGKSTY